LSRTADFDRLGHVRVPWRLFRQLMMPIALLIVAAVLAYEAAKKSANA
jgi:hypothetical protein